MISSPLSKLENDHCQTCGLFSFCNQANMTLVSKAPFNRHEFIHLKDDKFHSIYVISSGLVKTFQLNFDGRQWIHQFYFQGEILGFDAISLNHYPFTAMAVTSGEICRVPYSKLMDHIENYRQLYPELILKMSQRSNFGLYPTSYSAEQQMACFLIEVAKRLDIDPIKLEFELTMSRHDIASHLGLATETISRILTRLQQKKIIVASYKKIKIIDIAALQSIAQNGVVD